MSTWSKQKLGNIVDFIDGDRGKQYPSQGEFFDSGPCLFLSTRNIPDSKFDFSDNMFITAEKDSQLRKGKLQRGDYVLTTRGTVGNFAFYSETVPFKNIRINSGMVILRKKSDILDNNFLKLFLMSPSFIGQTKGRATGSAQPQLPIRDLFSIEVDLPDIKTQQNIASVIFGFDNLIENNEKRIKILEETAERLYREWFVKFKFPGHEKVRFVDSGKEYGKIPEGWSIKKVKDRFTTILGGTPSRTKSEYWTGGTIPWINSGAVNNVRITKPSELITIQALEQSATKMMPKRSTLLAITGATLGQVCLTEIECCANQSVIGIHDKRGFLNEYLYLQIKNKIRSIIALAGGGAQQHINKDIVINRDLLIPNDDLGQHFFRLVSPLFDEIATLLFLNMNLTETRDLLIPQLITGRRELKAIA